MPNMLHRCWTYMRTVVCVIWISLYDIHRYKKMIGSFTLDTPYILSLRQDEKFFHFDSHSKTLLTQQIQFNL